MELKNILEFLQSIVFKLGNLEEKNTANQNGEEIFTTLLSEKKKKNGISSDFPESLKFYSENIKKFILSSNEKGKIASHKFEHPCFYVWVHLL